MVFEKQLLKGVLVVSDTHKCSDNDFFKLGEIADKWGCNVLIHAGDITDPHLGHKALNRLENYVCLSKETNIFEENPEKYALPRNWHVFNQRGNNVFHFHYNLLGDPNEPRDICFYVAHILGENNGGREILFPKKCDLNFEPDQSLIYRLIEDNINKIKSEHKWVNWYIFGHLHHIIDYYFCGIKAFNPGAWQDKKCFTIIYPGLINFHQFSLTENNKVFTDFKETITFFRNHC